MNKSHLNLSLAADSRRAAYLVAAAGDSRRAAYLVAAALSIGASACSQHQVVKAAPQTTITIPKVAAQKLSQSKKSDEENFVPNSPQQIIEAYAACHASVNGVNVYISTLNQYSKEAGPLSVQLLTCTVNQSISDVLTQTINICNKVKISNQFTDEADRLIYNDRMNQVYGMIEDAQEVSSTLSTFRKKLIGVVPQCFPKTPIPKIKPKH